MPRPERPLGPEDSALRMFAADLRLLREKAGKPTYRELSARAHYSVTVLSDAASGRKLPSLAVTLAYVEACGGDVDEWRERWRELSAELAGPPLDDGGRPPYLGLSAFQVDDSDRFFGRDALVAQLVERVGERRFLGVFGASGSGKSSLLRAGLAARFEGRVVVFTPGPSPREECAIMLAGLTGQPVGRMRVELSDPANLHLHLRMTGSDVLLVVDQFEEIFTLCRDDEERAWFVDALVGAAEAATSRTRVVIGVRADFYGHCGRYPRLVAALQDSQVLVGPMDADELREAITQPAARAGCVLDTALVARLVAEAAGQPGALPLVSHAMLETWRRRRGLRLTIEGYEEAGGIQHAITRSGEEVYGTLDPAGQAAARQIFLRLTALGEGTADTKRRVARDTLDDGDVTVHVLERLAAARLITIDDTTVEITHEALIRSWPRLRDWLSDDREGLRLHRQLTEATDTWAAVQYDDGALYRGVRLASARDWAAANENALTPRERRFLTASLNAEAAEQTAARRRTRRLRQLVAALTVFVLLTTIAGAAAVVQWRQAVADRDRATSRQAGERAVGLLASDPSLAGQVGLAAYRIADTPEARSAVLSTFAAPYPTRLHGSGDQIDTIALTASGGLLATGAVDGVVELWAGPVKVATLPNTGRVTDVAFGLDGRLLAVSGYDGVRLWDVSSPGSPRPVATILPGTKVNGVAFNPDTTVLATAGPTAQLWDVRPREPVSMGLAADHEVTGVAFSSSGMLAIAGPDGRVFLQDKLVLTAKGPVSGLAFSPDGRTLAVADETHAISLVTDTAVAFPGPDVLVRGLAFTADGTRLALGGNDGVIRIMDVPARQEIARLTQPNRVRDVAFSRDGSLLASSSSAGRAYLWHQPLSNPTGHATELQGIYAHPPSGLVATTASLDPTVRLWRTDWQKLTPLATLTGHTDSVHAVAFHPSGSTAATASRDRTVRLWDVESSSPLAVLDGYRETVSRLAWSPDGKRLATGDDAGDLVLWDVTNPRAAVRLATLADNVRNVNAIAFSPDSRLVASGNTDRTVRLWDIGSTPRQIAKLTGFREAVTGVAFSADGKLLAGSGLDRTARLWNVADTGLLSTVTDQSGPIRSVWFSPDNRSLISTSGDSSTRLWDITDPRQPAPGAVLRSPDANVANVFFTPDGRRIAVANNQHTIRFWDTDLEAAARRVCEVAGTPITREEWVAQFGTHPYQPPCG
ncbi:hypothetical protein Lesp02_13880 [Lentzea sp. NBRC 105346]|uniref:nSTAND1 domain-containing NTPase n=1 Tax=Lentzea sp. NBRC 105346 TaxID=3032205 RepID=UPI00249FCCAC|nr:hypothetical protein [Lentzea sp. NBRC 105346]GLZ29198.1 hypothetical protein Lesp02_13880 [Lentzea sp. NBRC 105346]